MNNTQGVAIMRLILSRIADRRDSTLRERRLARHASRDDAIVGVVWAFYAKDIRDKMEADSDGREALGYGTILAGIGEWLKELWANPDDFFAFIERLFQLISDWFGPLGIQLSSEDLDKAVGIDTPCGAASE